MLIRSQNKEFLINLNNSFVIEVVGIEGDFKVVCSDQCNDYSVGCYSTKEKAIKVLDMIQEVYCNFMSVKNDDAWNGKDAVFCMPADEDVKYDSESKRPENMR